MSQPEASALPGTTAPVTFYEKRKKIYAKGVRVFLENLRVQLGIFTQILFYVRQWRV